MPPVDVLVVFGTRPEAVKLAPVIRALDADGRFRARVLNAGQHGEMLDKILDQLGVVPEIDLRVLRPGQTLTHVASAVTAGVGAVLDDLQPGLVVVQGDTTSAVAAALAGFYHRVPVAHVEAGLRTNDRFSPYPEEVNRRLITELADLHLAPTRVALANLLGAGVPRERIVVTGNTVIDAVRWMVNQALPYDDPLLDRLDGDPRRVVLVTLHRRESWGEPLAGMARALRRTLVERPDVAVVLPVHANPAVRDVLTAALGDCPGAVLCEPQSYGGFVRLLQRADLVVTDSGGVQEEAPSLGKPVLVLRETTERPEAVTAGVAMLVGTGEEDVVRAVARLLDDEDLYGRMARAVNPFGDGRAAARSVAAMAELLGLGTGPDDEFDPPADPRCSGPKNVE